MLNKNVYNFLPHLEDSIPSEAVGYTLSMYSIALEGWRRGLSLKFINENKSKSLVLYSLSDGTKEHRFQVARGDAVTKEAIKICVNKNLTKESLKKENVSVPDGDNFGANTEDEEIINYANKLGYPLVLKPSDGTGGNGVIANIKNEEAFKQALNYVKYELNYKKLIVEKYFAGEDYRLYVINNEVIAAFKKIPANVVGDGKHTIKELIAIKNKERTLTPALRNRPIKVDGETHNLLRSNGQTIESIPNKGMRIYLKTKNNVTSGGDSVDITDELTDEIKGIAISASKAIPGLVQCGVDMMVDKEANTGVVIEVNSRPHITAHLYPMIGKARDIPKAVVDYYFPDTAQNNSKPTYYFDFKQVWDGFTDGICKEFKIPDIPQGDIKATRISVMEMSVNDKYKNWIKKQALSLNLNGYIKHNQNEATTVIVISGLEKNVENFKEVLKKSLQQKSSVTITEKNWEKPVKIGFEIKKNSKKVSTNKTSKIVEEKTLQQKDEANGYFPIFLESVFPNKKSTSKKKNIKVKKEENIKDSEYIKLRLERDYYKKKYTNLINSNSWKFTAPVRGIGKIIKKNQKK
ncbi:ATP-grasp domain-containing protein [Oceanobacillus kimchii]|uniref:ATP-grasp domain-containing protein n=1 Tax=Oceanobacillus kimchii TaxID=746691 RepID=UPI003B02210B